MAVAVEMVLVGTREQHDALDADMGEALMERGGPPPGLVVHLARPTEGGFVFLDVWRTEAQARQFLDEVLLPTIGRAGLGSPTPTITPVWGMAGL
ncbi:hypothetical protein [Nocardioides limicola]|uniref:hypothetical protein n=1 Tax=Nocardioides limicola TaxID=2803368 RepID=UPI00193BB288|nr:hypothetical protein [Nocardioides sp. DJM-14]